MKFIPRLKSFVYAWNGIKILFHSQTNARFHAIAAVVAILLGAALGLNSVEWIALAFTIAFVLVLEAINTSLELLTDLVSPEYHPLAGKVKDVAAGAVLIGAIAAILIGTILFLPKLMQLL